MLKRPRPLGLGSLAPWTEWQFDFGSGSMISRSKSGHFVVMNCTYKP